MHILPYPVQAAAFHPYEAGVAAMARQLQVTLEAAEPRLTVEHVGSTAVPDCGGKGVIDLAVLYPEGLLGRAKAVLEELGFQRQTGPDPFPEERPMRVGSAHCRGRHYRIHAHVLALNCPEHRELLLFRDTLRRAPELRQRYEEAKRAILSQGITDPVQYSRAKAGVIADLLKNPPPLLGSGPLPAGPTTLETEAVLLQLESIVRVDPTEGLAPYYHFLIFDPGRTRLGHLNFRVGDTPHVRLYAGHIGYGIDPAFRGHHYALHACRAIASFVRSLYSSVIITCDPENLASRRILERLEARFLGEVPVAPHDPAYKRGARIKRRYQWTPQGNLP